MTHPSQSRLVGRATAASQLHETRSSASNNRIALVVGPAGIGKTTLLQEVRTQAVAEGSSVGWGVAGEWEGAPGLWPWFEALSDIDPEQDIISAGHEASPGSLDMAEMFRNVALWLHERGSVRDIVIVLEDLHHAHPTTVALFSYLTRRPPILGVTVLASSRPEHDEVDAIRCRRIVLGGLSSTEIIELANANGTELSIDDAAELARRTDGNPLFVQRLLEQDADGGDAPIPSDVAALIAQQIAAAPKPAQPLFDALAIFGSSSIEVLQQMTPGSAVESILATVSSDLLRLTEDGVGFRHGLVREVTYRNLDATTRFVLHARAAEVLEASGGSPVAIAHHLARAARSHRSPEAAEAARQAAMIERQTGAIGEAVHHFATSTAIRRELGDHDALVAALIEEAEALAQLGRGRRAQDRLIEAASVIDQPQPGTAGAVSRGNKRATVRAYARLRWLEEPNPSLLDAAFLISIAQRWLSDSSDPADQAVLHTAIATAGDIQGGRFDDVRSADAAVAAAAAADNQVLLGEARLARRRALSVHPARFGERRDDAEAALAIAEQSRDGEFLVRAQRMALTDALAAADRARVIVLLSDEPVSVAGRVQQALATATLAALEGQYDDADEVLDSTAKELDYLGFEAPALDFFRIVYSWDRGDLPDVLRQYEPLLPSIADPALRAAVALAKVVSGDWDVAATLVDEALSTLQSGEPTTLWAVTMGILTEAATAIDHPRCEEIYDAMAGFDGQCVIAATSAAAWIGAFDRYRGLLALRLGHNEAAVSHLEASLDVHQRMNATPWEARSHAALAVAYERHGRSEDASMHAARSQQLARTAGMDTAMTLIAGEAGWRSTGNSLENASHEGGPPAQRTASLVRRGDVWTVGFGTDRASLRPSKGLDYLALLLGDPGRDWSSQELYAHAAGVPIVDQGSAGPALDDKAKAAYRARRADLVEILDEATHNSDIGAADAARVELDFLESELLAAFGLGGRERPSNDNAERARVNVQRSIARAIVQIRECDLVLADHLDRSVQTGHICRYDPGPSNAVSWTT